MVNPIYTEIVRAARALSNAGQACGDGFIAGGLKCHVGVGDGNRGEIGKIPKFGRKHYAKVGGRLQRVAGDEKPNPLAAEWPPRRKLPGRPDTAPAQAAPAQAAPAQAARPAIQRPAPAPEDARRAQVVAEHNARAAEANLQAVREAKIVAGMAIQAEARRVQLEVDHLAERNRQIAVNAAFQAANPPQIPAVPVANPSSVVLAVAAPMPVAPVIGAHAHAPIGKAAIIGINRAIQRNNLEEVRAVNVLGARRNVAEWKRAVIAHMEQHGQPAAPGGRPAAAPRVQAPAIVRPTPEQVNNHPEQQKIAGDIATSSNRSLNQIGGRSTRNYSSSYMLKATGPDGKVSQGVFKPESGEGRGARPNIDDGSVSGARREVASYDIAKQLGIEHPVTTMVKVDGEIGSLQSLVDFNPDSMPTKDARGNSVAPVKYWTKLWDGDKSRLAELATFDYLTGNTDRHPGNILVDKAGKMHPIDHGLSFPERHGRHAHSGVLSGNVSVAMVLGHEVTMDSAADRRVSEIVDKVNSPAFSSWLDGFGNTHGLSPSSISTLKERAANLKSMLIASGGANQSFFKAMRKSAHGTKDADNFLARLRA